MRFRENRIQKELDITTREGITEVLRKLSGVWVDLSCMNTIEGRDCGHCENCRNWELMKQKLRAESFSLGTINRILLLAKLRPISAAFYRFFFSRKRTLTHARLKAGVVRFRGYAMLCFGNFRYAYAGLSELDSEDEIRKRLGDWANDPRKRLSDYGKRQAPPKLPRSIKKDLWLLGYIAKRRADLDIGTAYAMMMLQSPSAELENEIQSRLGDDQREVLQEELVHLGASEQKQRWEPLFDKEWSILRDRTVELNRRMADVRERGEQNTSHYLAIDDVDIYVATSMREEWEFTEVSKFIRKLKAHPELKSANLRIFDPTQSYLESRIDKGLVEGLMVKRAKCAVYMVQETDTFGKDSELAAVLAQGKPVVAYVPEWRTTRGTLELLANRPIRQLESGLLRLRADGCLDEDKWPEICDFLKESSGFAPYFGLVSREEEEFRDTHKGGVFLAARAYSDGLKALYEKRADSLKNRHPLALQVELETGVANGVLVVRTLDECARVVRALLMNTCSFDIVHDCIQNAHVLRERISGCPFRVVTDHETLTNSFWSFYLKKP